MARGTALCMARGTVVPCAAAGTFPTAFGFYAQDALQDRKEDHNPMIFIMKKLRIRPA